MKPVLLVSPDPRHRQELADYLTHWDCRLDECENSVQAFAALMRAAAEGRPYHRILVDCRGLDMPPLQFIASLQAESSLNPLPLALIAPPLPEPERQQLVAAGYLSIVESPLDKPRLFHALSVEPGLAASGGNLLRLHGQHRQRRMRPPAQEILVAESSEATRRSLVRILSKAGHHVYAVSNGEQALDALERHRFDLAILEWEMPSIGGPEVARMHQFSGACELPSRFLFLTSERGTTLPGLGLEVDPESVLSKPIQARPLLEAIQTALDTQPAPPQPAKDAPASDTLRLVRRPLLDLEVLDSLGRVAPAPGFVEQLVDEFIRDGSQWLARLQRGAACRDYPAFQAAAHALIDNAGHLGALALRQCAGNAMRLSREQFPLQAAALGKEAAISFEATRRALIDYLQRHAGASRS